MTENLQNKHQKAAKASYLSVIGNGCLAIVKGLAGVFGNSHALIADAIESISDVFSSALVLFGVKYAGRPPDENHPYGHGKAEPLITFGVVVLLVISAGIIAYNGMININQEQQYGSPKIFTLYVLGGIILWKEILYRIIKKRSQETHSTSLQTEARHHRTDALTSIVAFVGIAVAIFFGYKAADDWAALLTAGVILYNSYLIFRPALGEIMDEHRYEELIDQIRVISKEVPGIIYTEKCLIRKMGMDYHVDLHAVVNPDISVREGHRLAHQLQETLYEKLPQIQHVLIHVEPDVYKEKTKD